MTDQSPAERYARASQDRSHPITAAFAASQRFELDPFQIAGCHALEEGRSVLVAAPTGAGKTIVGEFAIHLAMREPAVGGFGDKAFYTTPDQGAVEPEVPRAAGRLRCRPGRPADRRHQHQRERPDRGHDHRGAPQHALCRFVRAAGAALRGDGRGALPRRPLPRCRVGGDHHPPAAGRAADLAERDRLQRRGVRRLARHGARRHRGDRLGDPPRAARAARAGARRSAAAVRRPCRHRDRAGQPGAHAHPVVQGAELREQPPRAVDAQRRESGRGLRGGSAPSEQGRHPSGALGERAAHRAARPAGGRQAAAAIEPAPGDLLHLQPRRVRCRGAAGAPLRACG